MPPPDENDPLDDSDIKLVETWIKEGAEWPEGIVLVAVEPQFGDADSSADQDEDVKADEDATADQDSTADQDADSDETQDVKQDADVKSNVNKNAPKSDAAKKHKPDPWNAIGSLHPATVHLPIGLLLAGGLFALLSLRGNFVMSDCACTVYGWARSGRSSRARPDGGSAQWNTKERLPHLKICGTWSTRFFGTESVPWWPRFLLYCCRCLPPVRMVDPDDGIVWKLGLIVLAASIGFVGYRRGRTDVGQGSLQGYSRIHRALY